MNGLKKKMAGLMLPMAWNGIALAQSAVATEPPAEPNYIGMVIFGLLFFGTCFGFAWYVWKHTKDESAPAQKDHAAPVPEEKK